MPRQLPWTLLPLISLAAACAVLPPLGSGEDERPLAYGGSGAEAGIYEFTDSTGMTITAGAMGPLRVISSQRGVVEIATPEGNDPTDVRATVRILDYDGRFENPQQGLIEADESDVQGAWTVSLSPRGRVVVVDTPTVSSSGRALLGGESFVRPFFVHLPGSVAEPGSRWVDTVSVTERAAGTVTRARSIITSELTGDTVLAGRRLALIRTESATTMEVEGASGGVEVLQRLSGTTYGTVLWDVAAGVLVERTEAGALEGTLELPGMGFGGMPVEATIRRSLTLRP